MEIASGASSLRNLGYLCVRIRYRCGGRTAEMARI
jgi:hypothetical protein